MGRGARAGTEAGREFLEQRSGSSARARDAGTRPPGRAGAGGGETHGGVPADARHTLGDKSRSLFVPRQDMLDRVTLRQGVIQRQIRSAGNAGDDANALSFEQMDDDLRAGSFYHGSTPPRVLSPGAEPGAYGVPKKQPPPGFRTGGGWEFSIGLG